MRMENRPLAWTIRAAIAIVVTAVIWLVLVAMSNATNVPCTAANRGTIYNYPQYHYYEICTGPPVEGSTFHWHRYGY